MYIYSKCDGDDDDDAGEREKTNSLVGFCLFVN